MYKTELWTILKSRQFLDRFGIILSLVLGLLLDNPYRIILLLLSGILSGVYYGCYNDIIWRPVKEDALQNLPHYRAHQLWIHIFCGIVGSITLYFLLLVISQNELMNVIQKNGVFVFVSSFIIVMSYVGLLPRLLWYTSYGFGQLGKDIWGNFK